MPHWLLPCDHRAEMLGWSRRQKLRRWIITCKDPVLMRLRWRRQIGFALTCLGGVYIALGI